MFLVYTPMIRKKIIFPHEDEIERENVSGKCYHVTSSQSRPASSLAPWLILSSLPGSGLQGSGRISSTEALTSSASSLSTKELMLIDR